MNATYLLPLMPKHTTPISVRVARWTAIAAAITAFGSVFNTMWSERPWWRETDTRAMSSTVTNNEIVMSPMFPENEPFYKNVEWSKWILIGSVTILAGVGISEGVQLYRKYKK